MSSRGPECGDKEKLKKGAWTFEEDIRLLRYIKRHGEGHWSSLAKAAGLQRCGKSCRFRWVNYLRPGIKHGNITPEEERIIIDLYGRWGSRWSHIAKRIPGRTDNEIKNYWRTNIKKKIKNSTPNQEPNSQNYSLEAEVQDQQVIIEQKGIESFIGNAIQPPLFYENNHDHAPFKMETPMNNLSIEEMFRDMEDVQVQEQVEACFQGMGELKGSIQDDMDIVGHDAIEPFRTPFSFQLQIPIERYATTFEVSYSTNPGLMYATHECGSNLRLDIMP